MMAREEDRRRMEGRDFTTETFSGAWGCIRGPMKMIFHKRADQRKYFLMVQSVV